MRQFVLSCLLFAAVAAGVEVAGIKLTTTTIGGRDYVSLTDLARALKGRSWRVAYRYVVLVPGDSGAVPQEFVFCADSTRATANGRRIRLDLPPILDDSTLYIPVVALVELFPGRQPVVVEKLETSRRGDTVSLNAAVRRVEAGSARGESLAVHGEAASSLEFRLSLPARCDSAVAAGLKGLAGTGIIRSVSVDSGASTALDFSFSQPAAVMVASRPGRLEVRFWPRPPRRITRIALDAGHGGKDPGAVGPRGTEEQRIVLDITARVKKKLLAAGFAVITTRETDAYVSLADRSKRGNGSRADIFVSIHANSTRNRAICGFETYFLSEAKTDWERAVAARENASFETASDSSAGSGDDLGLILADLAQNEFLWESSDLAACIQQAAVPHARIRDRGVRQANFHVLRNNFMPAVLVECGFLSNRSEEKLLRSQNHRERLAEGISRGIIAFAKKYGARANGHNGG